MLELTRESAIIGHYICDAQNGVNGTGKPCSISVTAPILSATRWFSSAEKILTMTVACLLVLLILVTTVIVFVRRWRNKSKQYCIGGGSYVKKK